MAETIEDLNFLDEDDELYNDSISDNDVIVDNDDWDDSSGNNDNGTMFEVDDTDSEDSEPSSATEDEKTSENTDVISELLRALGIEDSTKIKFQNDEGELEERNWKDLTLEEQLNILSDQEKPAYNPELDLDDNEIDLINRIRLSNMSVDDYITYEVLKGISNYAAQTQQEEEPSYIVDDISDDELYLLDLQTKVDGLSDDELLEALNLAKSNEDLYAKQIEGLRNEYKALEDNKIASEQALAEQTRQEQFSLFANTVANSINNFNSIGELDINMEDEDANELYQFITGTDPAGINYFAKALNDPDTLTRVAWFALNGEDVINSISDYYKGVISQVSKSQYERGKADAKAHTRTKKTPDVVVNPPKQTKNSRTTTIYDLD